ncbi:uncharacterized mitochondrial protein AtMg00310-like [Spinacia oleracea]|uniref:Uncharacterized mitochondrial protein AtMg00310-like n=1 Tax=Spinacia oleracea TaxID=3562 RepID=A0ABM3RPT4_SPIOL|nr:uncharacterized mitochondrial protein AtMg00310-like [Spinacia oleracea]
MRLVQVHAKYLGIPTIIGRSKKSVFATLKDRIWKKLQGWKEKLLSRAGKEVLIKSVIQAIPTYLMGVYKLPCSIIDEIRSMTTRFWWRSSGSQRKVHWKNWDTMCTPKCLGGMGFRDMVVFNEALLALGLNGSYSWRSIWSSKSLVKEGLIWRIGNGEKVNVYEDPWFTDEQGCFIL